MRTNQWKKTDLFTCTKDVRELSNILTYTKDIFNE